MYYNQAIIMQVDREATATPVYTNYNGNKLITNKLLGLISMKNRTSVGYLRSVNVLKLKNNNV